MKKLLFISVLILLASWGTKARAAVCSTLPANPSQSQIQTALTNCGNSGGGAVVFVAGTSSITSPMTQPCGVSLQGPTVAGVYVANPNSTSLQYPPTAHLVATFNNANMFGLSNCTTATTISGIDFQHTGALYINAPINNFTFTKNSCTDKSATETQGADSCVYINSCNNCNSTSAVGLTTGPNLNFTWNTIGDTSSCLSPINVMQSGEASDPGGLCNALMIQGQVDGLNFNDNTMVQIENGSVKVVCDGDGSGSNLPCVNGQSYMRNINVLRNTMDNVHRIQLEIQPQPASGIVIQNNSITNTYNANTFSLGISQPCCGTATQSTAITTSDNVYWNSTSNPGHQPPFGIEWWGYASIAANNLFQGYMSCGPAYGYPGGSSMVAEYNTMQLTAAGPGFICDEEGQPAPTEIANVQQTTVTQQTSALPTISPAAGAQTFPLNVTMADAGFSQPTPLPRGNTSIWYTTDGSTPVPGQGTAKLYTGPITLTAATTVKAVGMWGTGGNSITYPAPYGFAPSAMVSAAYTGSSTPTQFYLSPTGNDSNNGTSAATPWLTPNHAINCGATITAAAGTYSAGNFSSGKWGTVTCPSGNNVAWLACASFDGCKIISTTGDAMWIDQSFWGVQGWEVTSASASSNEAACFRATPSGSGGTIHHVIFANDIANGCKGGGYAFYNVSTTASEDYVNVIGSIAYNAAQGAGECFSGISVYQPIASDSASGTHIFVAGNFSYANVDPNPCAGGPPTDGEAVILDTFNGSQGGTPNYAQQAAVENNVGFFNGGRGFEALNNTGGTIEFKQNTSFGNSTDNNQTNGCFDRGEFYAQAARNVIWLGNLGQTRAGTSCSSAPLYGFGVLSGDSSSNISNSYWSGTNGNNTDPNTAAIVLGSGNTVGTNPAFANPINPGAPNCGSFASVPACMAATIANYTATVTAARSYGYQAPGSASAFDPLYPTWLCSVTLPAGLVTPGCGSAPTLQSGFQANTNNVNALAVGQTAIQQIAVGQFSDGTTDNLPYSGQSPTWSSSNSAVLNVTGNGMVSCVGPSSGSATANSLVTASPSGIGFSVWGWTCNAAAPALTGVSLGCAGGATTVAAGASLTCTATCSYSGGVSTNCTTADQYGTDASFTSSNQSAATVNGSGVVTGVAVGSTNLTASAGGFTSSPALGITVTAPAPVLQGVTLNLGGTASMNVGQTLQATATCSYSGGITTTCSPGPDQYGTSASGWASSSTTTATISSSGLVTAVAAGPVTLSVMANTFTSPGVLLSITSAPPPATLTGVAITGLTTVTVGQTINLGAQCNYSDGSATNCLTTDSHGNAASGWNSSATGVATVGLTTGVVLGITTGTTGITVHAGSFVSPAQTITVTAVPVTTICGVNQFTAGLGGFTSANYFNATYCVTGSNSGGYNSTGGGFYLPAGTQQSGANWDLVVTPASSGTAQAAAAICKGTYTTSGTASPAAWVTIPIAQIGASGSSCHLSANTAYWIELITNQGGTPPQGFYNCGGSCAGSLPSSGSGTYPYRYISNVYGTYTGMTTALTTGSQPWQSSQYISLTSPPPTLIGGYQNTSLPMTNYNLTTVGNTAQMIAFCSYSDGTTNQCFPNPDIYGNTVTACISTNTAVMTVGAIGSAHPCLVTGVSGGQANVQMTLTGGVPANPWGFVVQTYLTHPVPGSPARFRR